ncbi:D-alanyl-D-alanine carboxypeptidase/D-alanyl-D-alanine endopeptidase [Cellulomonas fimi]|uniref:D-alanyl-D-alanine carboxypeptidase/D-alanyl-D-alanine-endopeptidase n=1 Tax=Cellulomonas fimi (strain ATCC 484 / DSM 20113 / JCM 1341 / CCUG 24087 / LMG 16345 / NBRC 15513 / NCIMB 8980 / NCTC 7547 / NRS-133) TaxID=590998 RepID=F4GY27_CELFA|nr:D-alanyl-D-alanine carboxypeptidase/D-alanyl-D-alanine-endopeptidase [Cellulomonas fimi]AEE44695.1 D-alanyl-D-alanine carboxypeptidase/D-alanyl-D-alanine-endopeptidase [Cellulomonas fimi ATCC 484]NNH09211.1 D-alanyl-D-alanine carboxypeptidase/D-alanyl-D-alanine-endopeptidase [Cellulomonas fimi]VEH27033.1 D-alanyl-D-alanine carboxypeptidase precursor [Cellulomonas fimi]
MATAVRVVGTAALVVVLAGGAYATADAYDAVPGLVTLEPSPAPPAPFPTAPGATDPGDPAAALPGLDAQAPVPSSAALQGLVDGLVADPRMGPSVGVVVADQLTGEVLASHLADQGRTPASTAKLVTAVAALQTLGPDVTLPTRVVQPDGERVVLVGGGDMMLAAGEGDPDATVGHAGLADLAAQVARELALQGRTSVALGFDDSLFTGPSLSPAWNPADVSAGFAAPVTALAVDIAKMRDGEYPPRWPDPSLAAAKTFAQRLTEAGIAVTGTPTRVTASPGATVLGEVRSAPLEDVVHYFLDTSDNSITEVVARLVAIDAGLPASFEGGAQAVLHAVGTLGVDTAGAHLSDASGLGSGSVLSPQLLLGLLRASTDPANPGLRDVATGMPVAGLTGTLAERYTTSPARGLARAKTGSLPGVTALAGTVLDADRRQLVFVVLADQTPAAGQWGPRAAIDGFVTSLSGCGCG